jgi:hypothetical protein
MARCSLCRLALADVKRIAAPVLTHAEIGAESKPNRHRNGQQTSPPRDRTAETCREQRTSSHHVS